MNIFRRHPLYLVLASALSTMFIAPAFAQSTETHTIGTDTVQYDPTTHDGKNITGGLINGGYTGTIVIGTTPASGSGMNYVANSEVTLKSAGNDIHNAFKEGANGSTSTKLSDLVSAGKIIDGLDVLYKDRVNIGSMTNAIVIKDSITGTNKTVQTYGAIKSDGPVITSGSASDYQNVNNEQYIGMKVGAIDSTGGTLIINLGDSSTNHLADENNITLAAKDSILFQADGTGGVDSIIRWTGNNRIDFNASVAPNSGDNTSKNTVQNITTYAGAVNFGKAIGGLTSYTVNNATDLNNYNQWLVAQLQSGNLAYNEYEKMFDKAFTITNESYTYEYSATPPDEVFVHTGDRILIDAKGANAKVEIDGYLESSGANTAVRLTDNAHIDITGTLGSTGGSTVLLNNSTGVNTGVVNGNFITKENGDRLSGGGAGVTSIKVDNGSAFKNDIGGIINVNPNSGGGEAVGIGVSSAPNNALCNGNYSACNSGIITIGVNASAASGATTGVAVTAKDASFINYQDGEMAIGYKALKAGETIADLSDIAGTLNQKGISSAIHVTNNGKAVNEGKITIGKQAQNSAGLYITGSNNANVINSGTIEVKGDAATVPNMNYGILAVNSGQSGAIINNGKIDLSGVNSIGIKSYSNIAGNQTYVKTTENSEIVVSGKLDSASGTRNYGIWVEGENGGHAYAWIDGKIKLDGDGAIGVHARGTADMLILEKAVPEFATGAKDQIGFFAYGDNAHIYIQNAGTLPLNVSSERSTLFRLENGADFSDSMTSGNFEVHTSGKSSQGFVGTGKGTAIALDRTTLKVNGVDSTGMIIEGGASGAIGSGSTITLENSGTIAGISDSRKHDLSGADSENGAGPTTLLVNKANITTTASADQVTGLIVRGTATLENHGAMTLNHGAQNTGILLDKGGVAENFGSIKVTNGTGTHLDQGGNFTNNGVIDITDGTGIFADGTKATITQAGIVKVDDGVAGIRLANGATASLIGTNNTITTNGTAHGILLDIGAGGISLANGTLSSLGSGHGIENKAETGGISIDNSTINVVNGSGIRTATQINSNASAKINVSGLGTGFAFKTASGNTTSQDLSLGAGFNINVTGAKGVGIEALTTGTVLTSANVEVTHAQGGAALLAGTAKSTTNLGELISQSDSSPVVDLTNGTGTNFDNRGKLIAKTYAQNAVLGSSGDDTLSFTEGHVRGEINSGTGADFISITGGTLDGGISMGGSGGTTFIKGIDLSKTYHAQAVPGNNTLTLDSINARGGSFVADDLTKGINLNKSWDSIQLTNNTEFSLTDNLTLDGRYVSIDGTSTLFAGNNVNSIISAGNSSEFTVFNSGKIDLTNGRMPGDTLTIKGNYAGNTPPTGPSPFNMPSNSFININTHLNEGGALTNQITDRLLIEKDVSGTSYITVVPSGNGAITDRNRDGVIQANEGISIVQVGGTSTSSAFVLKEPVLAGAYAYGLYSFTPGESDETQRAVAGNGNDFWDYRLANAFVCPVGENCTDGGNVSNGGNGSNGGGNNRPQLTPQMPSYISLPLGIALYNTVILDDLHKRLGEVRHDMVVGNDGVGELYVRYIGARSKYKSNVSFQDYGYNFDLEVNASQIGANLFKFNTDNNDIFRGGVAWIHGNSTLKPKSVDGYSKTKLDSNTFALYLTWQKDNGFYIDGVAAYNQHRADVQTLSFLRKDQNLKARGWLASIETGYPFKFDNGVVVEPQAQLAYQSIKVKNFKDINGANLRYDDFNQTMLRLGVRGYKTWITEKGNQVTPYVRVNYYQNFGGGSKLHIVSDNYGYDGQMDTFRGGKGGKVIQVGLGVSASFKNDLSLFSEVDYQKYLGGYGSKGLRLNIGAKWAF